ncbi:MAG: hypothetical protein QMD92_07490 [bacterium]|nr:hypothetical protein [bacterium]
MELDIKSNQALDGFLADFGDIFNDKRESKRFENTIYGIIGAESPVVMQIAAHSPDRRENAFHTAKGIYRFLDARECEEQNLLRPIYEKTKKDFCHENEVVVVIDISSWEKPYAKKMERLCKVEKKDKR